MEEAKEETGNDHHHQQVKRFSSLLIQPNSNDADDDEELESLNKEIDLNVLAADQMHQLSKNLNIQYDDQMVLETIEALDEKNGSGEESIMKFIELAMGRQSSSSFKPILIKKQEIDQKKTRPVAGGLEEEDYAMLIDFKQLKNLPKDQYRNDTFFDKEAFWNSEHNFVSSNMVFYPQRDQPLYVMEPVAFDNEVKEDGEELRKLKDDKKDLKSTEMGRELSLIQQQQQQQPEIEELKNEPGTGTLNSKRGKSVKKVNELRPWFPWPSLSLIVKVVHCKLISSGGYGRQIPIAECLVGDETAMVVFTAKLQRQVQMFMSLKPGTTLILDNAHVQVYNGSMRLCVNTSEGGHVEICTKPAPFSVKEDNNMSLIQFDDLMSKFC